jgi:hypothetical protein
MMHRCREAVTHMTMGNYGVILTFSTGHSVRAEKVLNEAGIETKMIPVPRNLSSDCGVAVRIKQEDRESAMKALGERGVSFDRYEPM